MNIIIILLLDLFITAFTYLLVPIIFLFRKKPLSNSKIKKIVIINAICVWTVFQIIRIESGQTGMSAAVFLWSWIGYIMMKKNLLLDKEKSAENNSIVKKHSLTDVANFEESIILEKPKFCINCGEKLIDNSRFCRYCGIKTEKVIQTGRKDFSNDEYFNQTTTEKLTEEHVSLQAKKYITINGVPSQEKVYDKKYCSCCGCLIDNTTRKCTGCGKQYFRPWNIGAIVTVTVLAIIATTSIFINVVQHNTKNDSGNVVSKEVNNSPKHYIDLTDYGPAPDPNMKNPDDIISYDVKRIRITAGGNGLGDVYSHMIEHPDYIIVDNEKGDEYEVNYKVVGGIGRISQTFKDYETKEVLTYAKYGPSALEDWWYNVTLPDGTVGFVLGGYQGMYVDEIE